METNRSQGDKQKKSRFNINQKTKQKPLKSMEKNKKSGLKRDKQSLFDYEKFLRSHKYLIKMLKKDQKNYKIQQIILIKIIQFVKLKLVYLVILACTTNFYIFLKIKKMVQ